MNNTQKILLIVGIIIIIGILEYILLTNTNRLVEDTLLQLDELKQLLKEEKYDDSKNKSRKLNDKWFEYEEKLSFFIEHDEIEKVSTKIAVILENTKNKEYKAALEDVMEMRFLLEHVKDKNKLKLKNIF